eukprot:365389-Chlamydomonas_euryale.AAC.1
MVLQQHVSDRSSFLRRARSSSTCKAGWGCALTRAGGLLRVQEGARAGPGADDAAAAIIEPGVQLLGPVRTAA